MKSNTDLKNEYISLRNKVKKIIDEWDPIGLLKAGSPKNEYDSEIDDIVVKLYHSTNPDELARDIQTILIESFGLTYEDNAMHEKEFNECLQAAQKMLAKEA